MALWFATLWFQAPDGKTAQSDWVIEAETPAQAQAMVPTGPNSNSFAMILAERVRLPRRKPSRDAPGSGMSL